MDRKVYLNDMNRVLMSGVRYGGSGQYKICIPGNGDSLFPPITLEAPLRELGPWLSSLAAQKKSAKG